MVQFSTLENLLPQPADAGRYATSPKATAKIDVYVKYTGQNAQTTIPGSPFPDQQTAHTVLFDYGVLQQGSWPDFLKLIDEYGFTVQGGNTISVPTKL